MSTVVKDLGAVTAYADAVAAGYTGTKEEWQTLMASYASVAEEAQEAREGAEAAQDAAEDARDAAISAKTGAESAVSGFGTVVTQATNQAVQTVRAEGTTQVGNVSSEGTTQVAAVQAKGTEVIQSIPADYTQLSSDVTQLKEDLTGTKEELGLIKNYIEGYYVARDGTLVADDNYCASELIPCSMIQPKNCTFYYGTYGGAKANFAIYDANGNFIDYYGGASGAESRSVSNLPDTAIYCRFGFVKGYAGKLTSSRGYVYWSAKGLNPLENAAIGYAPRLLTKANSSTINTSGNFLDAGAVKNPVIMFYGKIGTFDSVSVGHGQGESYTEYITIDDTNLTFYSGTNPGGSVPHGLTISTYISVAIMVKSNTDFDVLINTLGGSYKRSMVYPNNWLGYKGLVFVKSGSANTFIDHNFTVVAPYDKNKWIFGDSYLSNYSEKRWAYYMQSWGFDNALLNAFPGEDSVEAYNDLMSAFLHGTPKYLIWCLGMNDPDNGAINPNWLNTVQMVRADCARRGIELVLATIPNVPIYDHTYKNAWVKSSGLRYIDFAEAVGATDAGSTWYDGCLETTTPRVHPTADGARLLAVRALTDVPELMRP